MGSKRSKFFTESYFHDVYGGYNEGAGYVTIKVLCFQSQRKNEGPCKLSLKCGRGDNGDAKVLETSCSCKAREVKLKIFSEQDVVEWVLFCLAIIAGRTYEKLCRSLKVSKLTCWVASIKCKLFLISGRAAWRPLSSHVCPVLPVNSLEPSKFRRNPFR